MEQEPPYPPLTEATEGQAETRFTDTAGVLVGFRTPEFQQGISVAGYHLHFLNDDRTSGGHVLDFTLERGEVAVSGASQLHLEPAHFRRISRCAALRQRLVRADQQGRRTQSRLGLSPLCLAIRPPIWGIHGLFRHVSGLHR